MNRDQRLAKNRRIKEILKPDRRLFEACQALRHHVENPNESSDILLYGGVYRHKDQEALMTVTVDGVEVGYKVKQSSALEMNPYFDRYAYMKVPGHKLKDLSKKEMKAIHTAIMDAFFEPQQGPIKIEVIGWDAMLFWQRFQVAFLYEKSPGLVSIAGGANIDAGGRVQ
ncbi:MAG: hypothetical protein WC637_00250 [Victivallales bacterium]|jgi:hypothetical protein